jgi:hypothetical protein
LSEVICAVVAAHYELRLNSYTQTLIDLGYLPPSAKCAKKIDFHRFNEILMHF